MAFDLDTSYSALAKLKPAVRGTLPPGWMFKVPPAPLPATLPIPQDHPTLAHPFAIPPKLYNDTLSPYVPVTIALVYITTVTYLNSLNKQRRYQPWAISKTTLFKYMVIIHNTFLALYSLWTFIGMGNALNNSLYWPWEPFGLAGTVDSLCKVNGPRGVGSAARYNPESSTWGITNRFFHLGADGLAPESTDVGRLWNEGLAFYGWLFYLSKFYEVLDTMIIIAKGKKSSFLQTYHHAGAMICMWAGIRYMSPPIWMFCFVNSFIHTIMYTFYLLSALHIRVPIWFKRTLTTMQIAQFVFGASFAFAHFFIKYQSPVSVPYIHHFGELASSVVSDATSAASIATASASADVLKYAKKALLRAAGREGLAQNVLNDRGQTFGLDADKAARAFARREETRYRDELQWTHCLDTSGQAFAIYINVLYLLPLTWLFGRFFVKSYLQRLERRRSSTTAEKLRLATESARDASLGSMRRANRALSETQGGEDDSAVISDSEFEEQKEIAKAKLNETVQDASEKAQDLAAKVKQETQKAVEGVKQGTSHTAAEVTNQTDVVKAKAQNATKEVPEKVENIKAEVTETAERVKDTVVDKAGPVKNAIVEESVNAKDAVVEKAQEVYETTKTSIPSKEDVLPTEQDVSERPESKNVQSEKDEDRPNSLAESTYSFVDVTKDDVVNSVQHGKEAVEEKADEVVDDISSTIKSATNSRSVDENRAESTTDEQTSKPAEEGDNTEKKTPPDDEDLEKRIQKDESMEELKPEESGESARKSRDNVRSENAQEEESEAETTTETKPPTQEQHSKIDTSEVKVIEQEPNETESKQNSDLGQSAKDVASEAASSVKEAVDAGAEKVDDIVNNLSESLEAKRDQAGDTKNAESPVEDSLQQSWAQVESHDAKEDKQTSSEDVEVDDTEKTVKESKQPSDESKPAKIEDDSKPDQPSETAEKGNVEDESNVAGKDDNETHSQDLKDKHAGADESKPDGAEEEPTYAEVVAEAVKEGETTDADASKPHEKERDETKSADTGSRLGGSTSDSLTVPLEQVRSSDNSAEVTQAEESDEADADSKKETVASKKSKNQRKKEKAKAKKEKQKQDKIIDESEPVRNEVKDTDTTKDKADDEAGA